MCRDSGFPLIPPWGTGGGGGAFFGLPEDFWFAGNAGAAIEVFFIAGCSAALGLDHIFSPFPVCAE